MNKEDNYLSDEELYEIKATIEFSFEFAEYIKEVDRDLFNRAKDYALGKKYDNVTFYNAS